jgi:hypothetical protein
MGRDIFREWQLLEFPRPRVVVRKKDFHPRVAAIRSKGNERGETARRGNVHTTPGVNTISEDGQMLRCAEWPPLIQTVALVVGQLRS